MKEKWYRFCLKHKVLAFLACGVPLIAAYDIAILFLWKQEATWAVIVIDALIMLSALAHVTTVPDKLINAAIGVLNHQCDPEPLYKETMEQQQYHKGVNSQVLLINHCAALSEMGEYEKVVTLLEETNIDKYAAMLPQAKFIYYNNLADAHFELHNVEKFQIWYQKSQQILTDVKNEKVRAQMRQGTVLAPVQALLIKQEYVEALAMLQTISCDNKRKQVCHAFCTARAYLGLGEKGKAIESLQYVISNGNKLHIVTVAETMLKELTE